MSNCIILGARSDIAQRLKPFLEFAGWTIHEWVRDQELPRVSWKLVICAIGKIDPVGLWWQQGEDRWESCIRSNLFIPIKLLRRLWPHREKDAIVCFFAGSNPNMIMDGYSAYNIGKMALLKAVEQLDHESQDAKIFALAPGIVLTKIHEPTLKTKWPNMKLKSAIEHNKSVSIERIYRCLEWCIKQPKEVVGGRNICVSDHWDEGFIERFLRNNPHLWKLRRYESM